MKRTIILAAAALGACTVGRGGPVPADADGEALLAEVLAGRIAGEPRSCVRSQDVRNTRSAGNNRILFDGPGRTVYVNHATGSCPRIQPWHAIRLRTVSTSLCSGELIRVFDPQTGVEYGGCSLGEFVPWRRTR
jgi:hypothetical protein